MSGLILPSMPPFAFWGRAPLELRIDVEHAPELLDAELDALQRRMRTRGDPLHGLPAVASGLPDLVFRCREADGEYYVYVEDARRRCLAGYTVFNHLIELNRRIEKSMRAPHSKYAPAYRRRGIASAVYECALQSGLCLISGARQSAGAHALWQALGRRHALGFVLMRDKSMRYLGKRVSEPLLDNLHVRMILFGAGWDVERLEALCSGGGQAWPARADHARVTSRDSASAPHNARSDRPRGSPAPRHAGA